MRIHRREIDYYSGWFCVFVSLGRDMVFENEGPIFEELFELYPFRISPEAVKQVYACIISISICTLPRKPSPRKYKMHIFRCLWDGFKYPSGIC